MKIEPVLPKLRAPTTAAMLSAKMSERCTEIASTLDSNAAELDKLKLNHRGRRVRQMSNNLLSLAQAIDAGDGTIAMVQDIQKRAEAFDGEIAAINEDYTTKRGGGRVSEFASTIPSLIEAFAGISLESAETAVAQDISQVLLDIMKRNNAIRHTLPSAAKVKSYTILRLPVIVTTDHAIDKRKAALAGFTITDFEGYPIIEDQLMLAVRNEYARQHDMSVPIMADEIVDTINAGTEGVRLKFVHDEGRVPKGAKLDFMYYWIIDELHYSRLIPVLGSYDDWGIAV